MIGRRRHRRFLHYAGGALLAAGLTLSAGCEEGSERIVGVGGGGSGPSPASRIEIIGGDEQNGPTLGTLSLPLVVGVSSDRDVPVADVTVNWEVSRGIGTLSAVRTATDALGQAESQLTLGPVLGPVTVAASLEDQGGPSVTFAARATVVRVDIRIASFSGPLGGDSLQVVVGDTVEWLNRDVVRHAVESTVVPEGGASFRSRDLNNSDRFRFVPKAAGLWEYIDPLSPSSPPPAGKIHAVLKTSVGDVTVMTRSTGTNLDRLYSVSVDGLLSSSIGPNDSITFHALTALDHVVRLLEVAPNCAVQGANPRNVTARADAVVTTVFEVSCE